MGKERIDSLVTLQREEVIPHYLRASTGSCHDSCKYGRKEAFPAKTSKEKFVGLNRSLDLKHNPVVKSPLIFKTSIVSKSSSLQRNGSAVDKDISVKCRASPMKKPLADPPEVIKQEVPLPPEDVKVSAPEVSVKKAGFQSEEASSSMKPLSSSANSGSLDGKRITCDSKVVKKIIDSKAGFRSEKASSSSMKSKPFKVKPLSSSANSGSLDRKNDSKVVKKIIDSKASAKKAVPIKINRSNKMSNRGSSTDYDKDVPEKTLHVIKVETVNGSTESASSSNTIRSFSSPASPKSTTKSSPSRSGMNENASDKSNTANPKEKRFRENHKTLTKSRTNISEGKHRSPVKLSFKSGKIMDIQTDPTGPRKLKFRKGITVGASTNGKAISRSKSFRKNGDNDETTDAKVPEKVVLKHQKMQGKRDAQGLFNNVIEATASKLAMTRKSKVKALVGAFETVISLQEKKPGSNSMR